MINPDGTVVCNRCGIPLDGMGVLFGMVTSLLDESAAVVNEIYCYLNECRSAVLRGNVLYPDTSPDNPICSRTGNSIAAWTPSEALLAVDTDSQGNLRSMAFCLDRGCDAIIRDQAAV